MRTFTDAASRFFSLSQRPTLGSILDLSYSMPPEGEFIAAAPPADFGAADSPMIWEKYSSIAGNCFLLKANLCIFRVSPVVSTPKVGNRKAATDCCASPVSIYVQ